MLEFEAEERAALDFVLYGPSGRAMASGQGQQGINGLLDEPSEVTVSISSGTGFVIARPEGP